MGLQHAGLPCPLLPPSSEGRRKRQPTPVLSPGKSRGWRGLVDYSPWGQKESDTTEQLTLLLPEFAQTRVHGVGDAIQPSHPMSSPSPPAPNLSQHQGLFQ